MGSAQYHRTYRKIIVKNYAYPEPNDLFKNFVILPEVAFYYSNLHDFILSYEAVQKSNMPHSLLMNVLQITYLAATTTAKWDRRNWNVSYNHLKFRANHSFEYRISDSVRL